jgi:endonuclease-3
MTQTELTSLALQIHTRLIEAFGEPTWRNPLPPVDELVSTILSQNTNDNNRDRAFNAMRAVFPTWEQVRDAPVDEIISASRSFVRLPLNVARSTFHSFQTCHLKKHAPG